ncbi:MAG: bifunctional metallophosphatase/5'-nucleotidase [Novosphingobium sp.]|nr:bifunctional metallophosphatase/5'-nucleotidase [Novosphingobium sp.]MCP5403337.1 bifunctional metallophosphatase/5'-nucleotidase [Novosphingobium sp.]
MKRLSLLLLTLALSACAAPMATRQPAEPVTVGIIAINDFHGNLEPPRQSALLPDGKGDVLGLPAGGAAWLASAIDSVRDEYAHHLTVSAGDLVGASPITSSLFLDEPTIGVMNRIGLDYNAVGNHEFDSGLEELRRKLAGGCEQFTPREPCQVEQFKGAAFPFLAANVILKDGSTLFPATAIRSFGTGEREVTIGLIGMTLHGTGPLAPPDAVKDITFADEADTANALVPELKAQGADAIVLLIHQGGRTAGIPDPDGCEGLSADIRPILDRLDPRVDVVVSGHTHWAYVCDYARYNPDKPFLLTSAGLWGEMVTDITLQIDPATDRVVAKRAHNLIVQSEPYVAGRGPVDVDEAYPHFEPRPDVAAYVARYVDAAKDYSLRKVGQLGAGADKATGELQNTGGPLGNLIADAQLAATKTAGAQIAFTNPFGIRRSLHPSADGSVTFGDIYAVQPFNNDLMTLSYTGAQIKAVLEEGFDAEGPEQILAPSAGFSFTYDRSRPVGDRIVAMTLDGEPIDPAKTYRVTVNNFLSNGGDTFSGFAEGLNRTVGMSDIAALEAWLKPEPARVPPTERRYIDARPDLNPVRSTRPPGTNYR